MTWFTTALRISEGLIRAIVLCVAFGVGAVVVRFIAEYVVNENRPIDFWVQYYDVRPTKYWWPVGAKPRFLSHSQWFNEVEVDWPDVMWCRDSEGPSKGELYRISADSEGEKNHKIPGKSGFYDDEGNLLEGSSPGFWKWSGDVPLFPSKCFLDPNLRLYPSPLVVRKLDIPKTDVFFFY